VQVLLEAIARVSEARDLESLLIDIVDSSIEMTGAERGLLVMRGAGEGELVVRVARVRGKKPVAGDLRYSTTVAGRVLAEARPLRAQVHSESEALELGRSVYDLKLRAVMCVPLATPAPEGAPLPPPKGVLYVDSRAPRASSRSRTWPCSRPWRSTSRSRWSTPSCSSTRSRRCAWSSRWSSPAPSSAT
jgi:GAF domain-containing protein